MPVSPGKTLAILIALFVLIQVIAPARTNPVSDPAASLQAVKPAATAALSVMNRSCRDCHSNETTWPWYSHVAPASWLVAHDVTQARRELNMSEFGSYSPDKQQRKLGDACEQAQKGNMPPMKYLLMHADAKLQPADVEAICSLSAEAQP